MADEDERRAHDWLATWQGMHAPEGSLAAAAGGAHGAVRALDRAVATLRLDDEPWRLRVLLSRRSKR